MVILIHPGKCDQAKECECPLVCPQNAWQRINEKWIVDETKCDNCEICLSECPAQALIVAQSKEDKVRITNEIKNDSKFPVDKLFIERYGSMPIKETLISFDEIPFEEKIVLEIFDTETIECLAHSIPYMNFLPPEYSLFKLMITDEIKEKFSIEKTPCLIVLDKEKIKNKYEGYTTEIQKLNNLF